MKIQYWVVVYAVVGVSLGHGSSEERVKPTVSVQTDLQELIQGDSFDTQVQNEKSQNHQATDLPATQQYNDDADQKWVSKKMMEQLLQQQKNKLISKYKKAETKLNTKQIKQQARVFAKEFLIQLKKGKYIFSGSNNSGSGKGSRSIGGGAQDGGIEQQHSHVKNENYEMEELLFIIKGCIVFLLCSFIGYKAYTICQKEKKHKVEFQPITVTPTLSRNTAMGPPIIPMSDTPEMGAMQGGNLNIQSTDLHRLKMMHQLYIMQLQQQIEQSQGNHDQSTQQESEQSSRQEVQV